MACSIKTKTFQTKRSLENIAKPGGRSARWSLMVKGKSYRCSTKMERVSLIREGIPYGTLKSISTRMNVPVKSILSLMTLPQTTYNKKIGENALLGSRDSELVMLITELLDFGIEVFNAEEEKFQRWLKKSNPSLGGKAPESYLDTVTGIYMVKQCLNRLEYGSFA
jgi:putative toxin-antitoxin system antitoxin component (TIGR02293 family)